MSLSHMYIIYDMIWYVSIYIYVYNTDKASPSRSCFLPPWVLPPRLQSCQPLRVAPGDQYVMIGIPWIAVMGICWNVSPITHLVVIGWMQHWDLMESTKNLSPTSQCIQSWFAKAKTSGINGNVGSHVSDILCSRIMPYPYMSDYVSVCVCVWALWDCIFGVSPLQPWQTWVGKSWHCKDYFQGIQFWMFQAGWVDNKSMVKIC